MIDFNSLNDKIVTSHAKRSPLQLRIDSVLRWDHPIRKRFIEKWLSIFNRRIVSVFSFALQVGDVIVLLLGLAYVAFCCIYTRTDQESGSSASVLLGVTIVFGCRNGILSWVFGLSLERAILWHQIFAVLTLLVSINHWNCSEGLIDGYCVLGAIILLIAFSIMPIRRYMWELFMKFHWILIVLLLVASILHGVAISIIAICYFGLDVILRVYLSMKYRDSTFKTKIERIGPNIVRITVPKGQINYEGGQFFFIMIPSITVFQFHPFSVISASFEDNITFYVKVLGDWTKDLYTHAGAEGKPKEVRAYFDGPYGVHSLGISGNKYKSFLCLSGGIGVTPILSTAKELLHQQMTGQRKINNLMFIWTGRDVDIVKKVLRADDLHNAIGGNDVKNLIQEFYHLSNIEKQEVMTDIEKQSSSKHEVKTISGRPKMEKYFEDAHQNAKQRGEQLIAVLACGPQPLIDSAEKLAMKWSKQGVRFDVHQEVFKF